MLCSISFENLDKTLYIHSHLSERDNNSVYPTVQIFTKLGEVT